MTPEELKAARQLLSLEQSDLASRSAVSIATIRRFEQGKVIGNTYVVAMRRAIEDAGVIFVPRGASVAGRAVSGGVVRIDGATTGGAPDPTTT